MIDPALSTGDGSPVHPVSGLVVAVIGASGGLGSAISAELDRRGCRLVQCVRDPARLTEPVPDAAVVTVDLSDAAAGDTVVRCALDEFGCLDGVVNAAGIVAFGSLVDTDDAVIEELFLTNVLGPLWLARRIAPALSATKGFLVNISAVVAEQPLPGMVAYSASKAALTAGDAALSRELRRVGVRVIDARPPHTETGLAERSLAGTAPRLGEGLNPAAVAGRLVDAIEAGESDLPSAAFR